MGATLGAVLGAVDGAPVAAAEEGVGVMLADADADGDGLVEAAVDAADEAGGDDVAAADEATLDTVVCGATVAVGVTTERIL